MSTPTSVRHPKRALQKLVSVMGKTLEKGFNKIKALSRRTKVRSGKAVRVRTIAGPSATGKRHGNNAEDSGRDGDDKTLTGVTPFPEKHSVKILETENDVNRALKHITDGVVGLDTEFTDRTPTAEEAMIEARFPKGSALRRSAVLGWQIVEMGSAKGFKVAWDNVGLRCIQIAKDNDAYILDMRKIRAVPRELRRILTSRNIRKIGVGITSDILVIWDDLRIEMQMLVDAGMMAKLAIAERYPKGGYGNLALKTSVEDILGFEISKEMTTSNWDSDELTEDQLKYAAIDAIAALKLFEVLEGELARKAIRIEQAIPASWYTFNSRSGEPTRLKPSAEGAEIAWKTSDCPWYAGGRFQGYP